MSAYSNDEDKTVVDLADEKCGKGWVQDKLNAFRDSTQFVEAPPFPRYLMIESANICNHRCVFCAYSTMERKKAAIDPDLFRRLVADAYRLGAREIGMHGGSEPFACKQIDEHIKFCKDLGFEYIYLSTNGALVTHDKLKRIIDAGLDSIKFSINGGDRETYQNIHGKDDFEKAIEAVKFVHEHRKTLGRRLFVSISYVEVEASKGGFELLKEQVGDLVDEMYHVEASNQGGQVEGLPSVAMKDTCANPFNRVHITQEGYLRGCCNDYENALALEDLNEMGLEEAWSSPRFRNFRRMHIEDQLDGTLCKNCVYGCNEKVYPVNPALSTLEGTDEE